MICCTDNCGSNAKPGNLPTIRKVMAAMPTKQWYDGGYIVVDEEGPMTLGMDGILWRPKGVGPVTLFGQEKFAQQAINRSIRYGEKHGHGWKYSAYQTLPVFRLSREEFDLRISTPLSDEAALPRASTKYRQEVPTES